MSEAKIEIHTEGGPVITGGTFTGVEFVAQKYVYKNNDNEELKMKNEEFSSFGGEADILHSSFPKDSSFRGEADILHSSLKSVLYFFIPLPAIPLPGGQSRLLPAYNLLR